MKWTDEVTSSKESRMTSTKTRVNGANLHSTLFSATELVYIAESAMNHGNWVTTAALQGDYLTFSMQDSDLSNEAG